MAGIKQPSDKSHFLLPDLGEGLQEAVAWVRAGNIGKITAARGFCYKARPSIGKTSAPTPPPPNSNSRSSATSAVRTLTFSPFP